MNWGNRILIAYILFASLIAGLVVICMSEEISLVNTDYYKQEIAYQDQIDRMQNFKNLDKAPTAVYTAESTQVIISFPNDIKEKIESGNIHFYRPSQAKMDITFPLTLDETGQKVISTQGFSKGLWKLRLSWTWGNREYYDEQIIVI